MQKIGKRVGILMVALVLLLSLVILISYVNHQIKLSREKALIDPPGELVEVNGHQMHVYTEGNGDETLVFMAGGGTSSPMLDFKSLYSLLSDYYKIAVVEKAGYGFSEVTEDERELHAILSETREALVKASLEGPYILFPHSMSGIEAGFWAQRYPDEVRAIIGLDMAVPAAYENYDIPLPLIHAGAFAAEMGLTRWFSNPSESDAVKHGTLSDEEEELYEMMTYRRTSTANMVNEVKNIKSNARKAAKAGVPDIPMLLFASNGDGTGMSQKSWVKHQKQFINGKADSTLIQLDASHFIHHVKNREIAEESIRFIEDL